MDRQNFKKQAGEFCTGLFDSFITSPVQSLDVLNSSDTCLIIIDMVNGFVKNGALSSERILKINDDIAALAKKCISKGFATVAFADCHSEESTEFFSYPVHCLKNSNESALTDELLSVQGIKIINKNSTNGFLEDEFQKWLNDNKNIKNFIVVGCCTDLCVLQFCLSLKADFNRKNTVNRIIVPKDLTATFDSTTHYGDFAQITALYNMNINGIEIVRSII